MTYQNIKLNNVRSLDAKLLADEYYDFMLYKGEAYAAQNPQSQLIANFSCPYNIKDRKLYSSNMWDGARNEGAELKDIGLTGIDNGFIKFEKDRISNKEFLGILTGSTYSIESGDTQLFLSPVAGNVLNLDYPTSIETDGENCYMSFKGGFYQGFYKLHGFDYQVIPNGCDVEWNLCFRIRPRNDYETASNTLNDIHPENKGIFFYLGTRAENKFFEFYNHSGLTLTKKDSIFKDDYLDSSAWGDGECKPNPTANDLIEYAKDEKNDDNIPIDEETECGKGDKAFDSDYLETDALISESAITDSFGHELTKKGYYEIESDNKFLLFDRTADGFTTQNWVEGTTVTLAGRQDWENQNYFPIMNRTKTGYTVENISEYQEESTIPYDIYKDIKNNAFALRITDNGAIGYKYGATDCSSEAENHYAVKEEYSKEGLIKFNEWNDVVVKVVILNPSSEKCDPNKGKRRMKLQFFVNGFLVLISEELSEFNFRELNDVYQKQEGVSYNISLGGGTQGLIETVLPDYYSAPKYILPIERDFCGTFIGDIESFQFYDGHVNYLTLKNYL